MIQDIHKGIEIAFKRIFETFGQQMNVKEAGSLCDLRTVIHEDVEAVLTEKTACGSTIPLDVALPVKTIRLVKMNGADI